MRHAVFTIIAKNYLAYARVLMASLRKFHPEVDLYVFLADRTEERFDPVHEPFRVVLTEHLAIPKFQHVAFKYSVTELNTAVKPFCIEYLFEKLGYQKILFLDPDILVTHSLERLYRELESSSIILTPHITQAIRDEKRPNEIDLLLAGSYNLGFIGLSDTPTVRTFLSWWKERVYEQCLHQVDAGLFVDQKWIDLVPSLFDNVRILKDPGLNVAYWNLAERPVTLRGDSVERASVRGEPLFFFHFSGFEPDKPSTVSKHQTRFSLDDLPEARPLFLHYRDLLFSHEYNESKRWPYAYGAFDNGVPVPPIVRRIYHALSPETRDTFGNPFTVGQPHSLFQWLNTPKRADDRAPAVTNLLYEIWNRDPQLRQTFPQIFSTHVRQYVDWIFREGRHRYHLPSVFLRVLRSPPTEQIALTGWWYRISTFTTLHRYLATASAKSVISRMYYHPELQKYKFALRRKIGDERFSWLQKHVTPVVWRLTRPKHDARQLPTAAPPRAGPLQGINIAGHLRAESGVGEAARAVIKACMRADIPHAINNFEWNLHRRNDPTILTADRGNPYSVNLIHVNADQAEAFSSFMGKPYFTGKYNIGYWFWEQSDFPPRYHHAFTLYDEIWTASSFAQQAFAAVSPVPVVKIPPAIECPPERTYTKKDFGLADDAYVFLFMFDILSFFERKNPLAVIEAFTRAFSRNERVLLVIKTINGKKQPDVLRRMRERAHEAPVKFLDAYLTRDEIHGLLSASDCYVSLHRSEGFGFPLAEAMYFGKPVIATHYSGNADYMTPKNSYPVHYSYRYLAEDIGPYPRGSRWADPDIEHAASLLRHVYEHRAESAAVGAQAARDMRSHYSPAVIGTMIQQRMEIIDSAASRVHTT